MVVLANQKHCFMPLLTQQTVCREGRSAIKSWTETLQSCPIILSGADIAISVDRRLGLLQNGPDAIAIYRAPAGAFPYDTPPTTNGLIDAIVYNTGDGLSHTLVDKLLPGMYFLL